MKRNKFNLGYTHLTSFHMGELIPVGLLEVLPGDSVQMSSDALVRAAPLVAPPMHPVDVRIHHWFVPHRLVWTSFPDFITGGADGNDATVPPRFSSPTVATGDLMDYLGYAPAGALGGNSWSALPVRGYQLIWNEWYRDQDLQTKAQISLNNGNDTTTDRTLQKCDWEKDYFTSARPWELKGPAITVPISGPVTFTEGGTTPGTRTLQRQAGTANSALNIVEAGTTGDAITAASTSASLTVNQLRQSLALQRFEEARARYGSRYTEYLRYLGVRSSDARLQRPEYLGGGRARIQFSEVLQTGGDGTNPVSTMRGHGITGMRSNRFRRFFEEHGFIHSLMSIRPKTIYTQNSQRHFMRTDKTMYWQKELEHIGQQGVMNGEVFATNGTPTTIWGYQDRYDEYRRSESRVSGEYRTTLNMWHFARSFASLPALNSTFVSCVPSVLPFADQSGSDTVYAQIRHRIVARRLVAQHGVSFTF